MIEERSSDPPASGEVGAGATTGENDQNLTARLLKLPGNWNICFYPYSQ